MTVQEARQRLLFQLKNLYDERESASITDWVLEHLTGWKKSERIIHKDDPLTPHQKLILEKHIAELSSHKPVQYVLGEAWFQGLKFHVNENTLIPRPETEELVELFISRETDTISRSPGYAVLDIGTGSGCIPISLKKKFPSITVHSCDISTGALETAVLNAKKLGTDVHFFETDILDSNCWPGLPQVNSIISNPPYIPLSDKETMDNNVVMYEPWQALFVENERPLVFYEAIAELASSILLPGGGIYVETHESHAEQVAQLFRQKGFKETAVVPDMQKKSRLVSARKMH